MLVCRWIGAQANISIISTKGALHLDWGLQGLWDDSQALGFLLKPCQGDAWKCKKWIGENDL